MKEKFVPQALLPGKKLPNWYPNNPNIIPQYEDNQYAVLRVCICGGCKERTPALIDLLKRFRLNVFYDVNGVAEPIDKLLNK